MAEKKNTNKKKSKVGVVDGVNGGNVVSGDKKGVESVKSSDKVVSGGDKKSVGNVGEVESVKNIESLEKKKSNKLIFLVLLIMGLAIAGAVIMLLKSSQPAHSKYDGMKFEVVREGELIFYKTVFDVIYENKPTKYVFYLRNDPKELEKKINFKGELELRNFVVMESTTENLFCDGDWSIALANLLNLEIFNMKFLKDEDAGCDPDGQYMFIQITEAEKGEKSRIEQYGPSCYKLIVSDCEILPVTERFIIETFSEVNKILKDKK